MKPLLLLVDLQNDYLAGPGLIPSAEVLIRQSAVLLEACRERHVPVIHIWTTVRPNPDLRLPHWKLINRWLCVAGTPGHDPPEALRPAEGEVIVHKTGFNPFADPKLEQTFRESNCDTVIVAGLHVHACVRTTAVECLERGCQVHVAAQAVASNDPIHAAASGRWLTDRCIAFESTDTLLALIDGVAPHALLHRSPRLTDKILFEIPAAGAGDVAIAAAAAQRAWLDWQRTPWSRRKAVLENMALQLEAAEMDLAQQMAIEIGKPVSHGMEEVRRAASNLRDVTGRAGEPGMEPQEESGFVRHCSLGVVALISAWNNPVAIPLGKIAPALAYGNTVVWKPAPAATLVAKSVLKLLRQAGVPPDIVRLVCGGDVTARDLAADKNVNAVTLTGSLSAGYAILEICARRILPLQAELSGNNAAILWDDADLSDAVAQVAWGAFAFAGQRCTANRRVIVHRPRLETVLKELKAAAERLVWGDPLEEATEIGPVLNTAKRDEIATQIENARTEGRCRVVPVNEVLATQAWTRIGAYSPPVILVCEQPDHPLVQEETMGPVLVVQVADDFDHALSLCNGVRHGLVAALFSRSPELQQQFLERAQAGILKLNASTAGVDVALPFGGWKASGLGPPEHGDADRLFYTRLQAVYGFKD